MKLFIYENALPNTHDSIEEYKGTTPFCKSEINEYFQIVKNYKDADYFYMGQISCGTINDFNESQFKYLQKYPKKHIVTIEGDWAGKELPLWLQNCICVGNAAKVNYKETFFCVRPCMSKFLVDLAKNRQNFKLENPYKKFGFIGQLDPHGTRNKMVDVFNNENLPNEISINYQWLGGVNSNDQAITNFIKILQNNIFSLCPRGAGEDTIRFYESTYFSRIPIVIGKCKIMGEDYFDTSFFYRIDPDISSEDLGKKLVEIYNTDNKILIEKSKLAKKYFNEVVVEYFKSPTKFFIEFLKRHKL